MDILIGSTGFVGSNLCAQHKFDGAYNSKNISEAFGTNPDLLVYAGVPAEMFLANKDPDADRLTCENAAENISKINPKRVVLISTIAVLDNPVGANEDVLINENKLTAYGLNRLRLEHLAAKITERCHIIRLPALFGNGIKKNFIYDMIFRIPASLNKDKFAELSEKEPIIAKCYAPQGNGFYKLIADDAKCVELKTVFARVGFSALNFTDSRSRFQFYNLAYLWGHIETTIKNELPLLHMATQPLSAGNVYEFVFGKMFVNELAKSPFNYDYRTKHNDLLGGAGGYIFGHGQVLVDIKTFVERIPG